MSESWFKQKFALESWFKLEKAENYKLKKFKTIYKNW